MNKHMEILEKLALNVVDSYPDFVSGLQDYLWDDLENTDKMITYMKEHPDAASSDILEKLIDLKGIDTSPLPIIEEESDSDQVA